jgi:hypothetical protein
MNVLDIDYCKLLNDTYEKHQKLIVAFDFDNTVFDYHKQGIDYSPIVNLLKDCDALGFPLICLTSNTGDRLIFIKHYLEEVLGIRGIKSLSVNDQYLGSDSIESNNICIYSPTTNFTKPYFNILLDDKAGLKESYERLNKLILNIKLKQE